jgi:hypothetical protein
VAEAPLGDATQGSPGNAGIYTGGGAGDHSQLPAVAGLRSSPLPAIPVERLLDSNDLTRGIVQAQRAISDYYILGYYSTNTAQDGKFRRIKISLAQGQDAKLDYRQGYYADKEFSQIQCGR